MTEPLFNLDNLSIASPCQASWNDMDGDDKARFCGQCKKKVYDISAMTRAEAGALFAPNGLAPCVRLFRRKDGTVVTSDCPVGLARKMARRARRWALAVAGLLGLSAAGTALGVRFGDSLRQLLGGSPTDCNAGPFGKSRPPLMGAVVRVEHPREGGPKH